MPPNLISRDLEIADYAFQGDIVQVRICYSTTTLLCLTTVPSPKLTFIDGDVDERTPPYVSITGTVSSFHAADHSFDMSPLQYIALTHSASSFPIHGFFVESKRWGEGRKPKLFAGTSVSFGGFIDRIHRERNLKRTLSQVEINVTSFSPAPTATNSQCMFHYFLSLLLLTLPLFQ
jgi:hypothetical protein